ncbi:BON domain-containing protein [Parafilimonas sp.]|uniref:BON domain-containing protein n=1 Tax=Parafilimonas sp. TaxID=1969739 RepID=UPI0039E633B6
MKNLKFRWPALVMAAGILFASCSPKDADIQKAVNDKLAENPGYTGITATVADGVVTLTGSCETDGCDASATDAVKPVKGVKEVKSTVTVTPPTPPTATVQISPDDSLKTAVDGVISGYNGVTAAINDGIVTLTGKIKRTDLQALMIKLHALKPKKIDNKLTIE